MYAPTYPWNCLACVHRNPPGAAACVHCGLSATASRRDVERHITGGPPRPSRMPKLFRTRLFQVLAWMVTTLAAGCAGAVLFTQWVCGDHACGGYAGGTIIVITLPAGFLVAATSFAVVASVLIYRRIRVWHAAATLLGLAAGAPFLLIALGFG